MSVPSQPVTASAALSYGGGGASGVLGQPAPAYGGGWSREQRALGEEIAEVLKLFDRATEWADLITSLQRLHRALQRAPPAATGNTAASSAAAASGAGSNPGASAAVSTPAAGRATTLAAAATSDGISQASTSAGAAAAAVPASVSSNFPAFSSASPMSGLMFPAQGVVARRLAQCLNPALPSGVHTKALEVYALLFERMGAERLAEHVAMFAAGLFPLLHYASLQVKDQLLSLYEQYVLPLGQRTLPALPGVVGALLPGYDREHPAVLKRVRRMLERLRDAVEPTSAWWASLWTTISRQPHNRLPALLFLTETLPRPLDAATLASISPSHDLIVTALAHCLTDSQVLTQRAALDLLILHLPLTSGLLSDEHVASLVRSLLGVLLRREQSLSRRVFVLFSEQQQQQQQPASATQAGSAVVPLSVPLPSDADGASAPSDAQPEARPDTRDEVEERAATQRGAERERERERDRDRGGAGTGGAATAPQYVLAKELVAPLRCALWACFASIVSASGVSNESGGAGALAATALIGSRTISSGVSGPDDLGASVGGGGASGAGGARSLAPHWREAIKVMRQVDALLSRVTVPEALSSEVAVKLMFTLARCAGLQALPNAVSVAALGVLQATPRQDMSVLWAFYLASVHRKMLKMAAQHAFHTLSTSVTLPPVRAVEVVRDVLLGAAEHERALLQLWGVSEILRCVTEIGNMACSAPACPSGAWLPVIGLLRLFVVWSCEATAELRAAAASGPQLRDRHQAAASATGAGETDRAGTAPERRAFAIVTGDAASGAGQVAWKTPFELLPTVLQLGVEAARHMSGVALGRDGHLRDLCIEAFSLLSQGLLTVSRLAIEVGTERAVAWQWLDAIVPMCQAVSEPVVVTFALHTLIDVHTSDSASDGGRHGVFSNERMFDEHILSPIARLAQQSTYDSLEVAKLLVRLMSADPSTRPLVRATLLKHLTMDKPTARMTGLLLLSAVWKSGRVVYGAAEWLVDVCTQPLVVGLGLLNDPELEVQLAARGWLQTLLSHIEELVTVLVGRILLAVPLPRELVQVPSSVSGPVGAVADAEQGAFFFDLISRVVLLAPIQFAAASITHNVPYAWEATVRQMLAFMDYRGVPLAAAPASTGSDTSDGSAGGAGAPAVAEMNSIVMLVVSTCVIYIVESRAMPVASAATRTLMNLFPHLTAFREAEPLLSSALHLLLRGAGTRQFVEPARQVLLLEILKSICSPALLPRITVSVVSYASIATSLGKCAQVCFEQLLSGRQTFEYILSEWIALIIHLLPIVITSATDIRAFFVTTLLDMSVPLLQPAHRSSEAARIASQLVARGLISLFHILADELNLHVASAAGAGSAAGGRSGFDDFVASVGRLFAPRSSARQPSDESTREYRWLVEVVNMLVALFNASMLNDANIMSSKNLFAAIVGKLPHFFVHALMTVHTMPRTPAFRLPASVADAAGGAAQTGSAGAVGPGARPAVISSAGIDTRLLHLLFTTLGSDLPCVLEGVAGVARVLLVKRSTERVRGHKAGSLHEMSMDCVYTSQDLALWLRMMIPEALHRWPLHLLAPGVVLQCWTTLRTVLRDLCDADAATTADSIHVLSDFVAQVPDAVLADRKLSKDIQETLYKLVDVCSQFIASSLSPGTSPGAKPYESPSAPTTHSQVSGALPGTVSSAAGVLAVPPPVGAPASASAATAAPPGASVLGALQALPARQQSQQPPVVGAAPPTALMHSSTCCETLRVVLLSVVRTLYEDRERAAPMLALLCQRFKPIVLQPARLRSVPLASLRRGKESIAAIFASFADAPHAIKAWRRDMMEMLNDDEFFRTTEAALRHWQVVFKQFLSVDHAIVGDLAARFGATFEAEARCGILRRLAFVIWSSEPDSLSDALPAVQERIFEAIRAQSAVLTVHALLVLRAVILRFNAQQLQPLWCAIAADLVQLLTVATTVENLVELSPKLVYAIMQFVDFASLVSSAEFHYYRWMFVSDCGMLCGTDRFAPYLDRILGCGRVPASAEHVGWSPALPAELQRYSLEELQRLNDRLHVLAASPVTLIKARVIAEEDAVDHALAVNILLE